MAYLSPPTLTQGEQRAVLLALQDHPRDHAIVSLALGTGLRISEIVGLEVGDVYAANGQPKTRVRIRPEIGCEIFWPGPIGSGESAWAR